MRLAGVEHPLLERTALPILQREMVVLEPHQAFQVRPLLMLVAAEVAPVAVELLVRVGLEEVGLGQLAQAELLEPQTRVVAAVGLILLTQAAPAVPASSSSSTPYPYSLS
jgi:hypothetical protein